MTSAPNERPFQFTLGKLFWLVALCAPVMFVSRTEWDTSRPFLTIATAYVVSVAINVLFFGTVFPSLLEWLVGGFALFGVGLLSFCAGFALLATLLVAGSMLIGSDLAGSLDPELVLRLIVWLSGTIAIVAGNWLLVSQRRWNNRMTSRGGFALHRTTDNASAKAP